MNVTRQSLARGINLLLFLSSCLVMQAHSETVSLAWNASPDTNVVGYSVYYGYKTGDYSTNVNVGQETNWTFLQLTKGSNYFFVVTAYNMDGVESLPSNEVIYQPVTTSPQIVVTSPCNISINAPSWSTSAAGGARSVILTDSSACSWTNFSPCSWLSVSPTVGGGSTNVVITASANSNTNARSCIVQIAGQDFYVSQAGAEVSLSKVSLSIDGSFYGLFSSKSDPEIFGSFSLKKAKAGVTGKIRVESRLLPFSTKLDSSGHANVKIQRRDKSTLTLLFNLSNDGNQLEGTISDGVWDADLLANRAVFNSRTNPAPYAGRYTIAIVGPSEGTTSPGGIGFATVNVLLNGMVLAKGTLGDGRNFSHSTMLSQTGMWPFCAGIYNGGGGIGGWLYFDLKNTQNIPSGELTWTKPAALNVGSGFSNNVVVIGSSFHSPDTATNSLLGYSNGTLTFMGGDLDIGVAKDVIITLPLNRIESASKDENKLTSSIKKKEGSFTGSLQIPPYLNVVKFKGCILQNRDIGCGFFVGTNANGRVILQSVPSLKANAESDITEGLVH